MPYKWRFFAAIPGESKRLGNTERFTEPQLSSHLTSQALTYIVEHPGAPFAAALHNTIRMLELEGTFAWRASAVAQGISTTNARTGVISFYILTAIALLGVATRAARRVPKWVWVAGILMWLSTVVINMETPRFREPVDAFLVLLAACALSAVAARAASLLGRRAPVRGDRGARMARGPGQPIEVIERLP